MDNNLWIDVDDTICSTPRDENGKADYHLATPKKEFIAKLNRLRKLGYRICVWTARGQSSGRAAELLDLTKAQLRNWGLSYDEIQHKPSALFYVDDKGLTPEMFNTKFLPKIGFLAGQFDVIHGGYIRMFEKAREYCDKLVVGLQTDSTIDRPDKIGPVQRIEDRKKILESLRYVDKVEVYMRERDLPEVIKKVRPDVRFLGEEYQNVDYVGKDLGTPIVWIARDHGISCSNIKMKIYKQVRDKYEG